MTLEEAIEILCMRDCVNNANLREEQQEAISLGIEALKREQLLRSEVPYDRDGLLPGETEE